MQVVLYKGRKMVVVVVVVVVVVIVIVEVVFADSYCRMLIACHFQ